MLHLFVKDEAIKKPLKDLVNDQTDFTKKTVMHILNFIDETMKFLYKPFTK